MKRINLKLIYRITLFLALMAALASCVNDLDTVPLDEDIQTDISSDEDFDALLAKCYSAFILGGQSVNDADIRSINVHFSSYLRQYWNLQELPTDEAICAWDDGNLRDLHDMDWNSQNEFITAMYSRINLEVTYCNKLIQLTQDKEQYSEHYFEARMLRALSYWHLLDLFRTGPFVLEDDPVGSFFFPEQGSAGELFSFIESELKAIEDELPQPGGNEYGRADRALAWMVLAKLYLNAEAYINEAKYTECLTYCNKIINSGNYFLEADYRNLFLADNHLRTNEIIFPICSDGKRIQQAVGMSFLIHAAIGGTMKGSDFGVSGGWGGNRTTSAFVTKFNDISGETDSRAMFHTDGQTLEIENVLTFTQGYTITKYRNITSTGEAGSDAEYVDTDFPMFRYADVLLMYAEAVLRGGSGGDSQTALNYINTLRERAYGDVSGNISVSELTLDFLLDERSRELYWEGHRRSDLVRFGKLTGGTYLWPWKGAVAEGIATNSKYDVCPIPSTDINANPNLIQNEGY
ncbi:RagB/SusD family nutrient uptake outer membrane protein [uncultured Draconibacterium sp.]|uniref:RagB/SusD family nutrient uptake outer membrane protein n=1 Tax=uncultured Draconibacterium sp. TaxID=1573823 RepID=UPI0029BFC8E7|nr:RagB/SusD family nutrient uptake outer membrane protein [uncultured Draconibacterium sp.]